MPLEYERDDRLQLITVTVTEPYSVEDILNAIDRQYTEDTWGYAVLYNLRSQMTIATDSQQIADYVASVGQGRPRGPVGIAITGQPEQYRRGLRYSEVAKQTTRVEVLLTAAQLDDWLTRNTRHR
jgi:hypothetical protein